MEQGGRGANLHIVRIKRMNEFFHFSTHAAPQQYIIAPQQDTIALQQYIVALPVKVQPRPAHSLICDLIGSLSLPVLRATRQSQTVCVDSSSAQAKLLSASIADLPRLVASRGFFPGGDKIGCAPREKCSAPPFFV